VRNPFSADRRNAVNWSPSTRSHCERNSATKYRLIGENRGTESFKPYKKSKRVQALCEKEVA
jgi:hypothetical protein